jgi:hypothetical protein
MPRSNGPHVVAMVTDAARHLARALAAKATRGVLVIAAIGLVSSPGSSALAGKKIHGPEELVVTNPYCGLRGYQCRRAGWGVPSYTGFSRDHRVLTGNVCHNIRGAESVYRLWVNPATKERFIEVSYQGTRFAYLREIPGKQTQRFVVADVDLDGVYETRSESRLAIPCPPALGDLELLLRNFSHPAIYRPRR